MCVLVNRVFDIQYIRLIKYWKISKTETFQLLQKIFWFDRYLKEWHFRKERKYPSMKICVFLNFLLEVRQKLCNQILYPYMYRCVCISPEIPMIHYVICNLCLLILQAQWDNEVFVVQQNAWVSMELLSATDSNIV